MPVCVMCDGREFSCLDGKFFCVECDTQSQDFVDEQAPELLGDASFRTKQLKKKKEKRTVDKGLPWRTVEGFQLIIKAQVATLIDLGINPAIDGVMQQIWFKYVHRAGLAILDRNLEVAKAEEVRFRDYFMEYFKEDILPKMTKLKLRISKDAKRKLDGQELTNEQEWFSVDTDASEGFENDDESSTSCSESSRNLKKRKNSVRGRWCVIIVMSKMKMMCFCYLALRWCKEPVTIGDLIHWAEIGKLPYYGSTDCFLPHMKMYQYDHETFVRIRVLEYSKVMWMSHALSQYLGMPDLPAVDINTLITRYLFQLNLPLALEAHTHQLLSRIESQPSLQRGFRNISIVKCGGTELTAASLIAIALKLFFVLNDKDEWRIDFSKKTCRMHGVDEEKCTIFTWENWVKQHLLQQANDVKSSYTLFDRCNDIADVGDIHMCMENYLSVICKGTQHRTEAAYKIMKERSELKQHAFKHLVEKQGSAEEILKKKEVRRSTSYKLLGRGNGTHSQDFTPACLSILTENIVTNGTRYVRYDMPMGEDKISEFHHSYIFLLQVLSELTYADLQSIHDYIWAFENVTVENFPAGD